MKLRVTVVAALAFYTALVPLQQRAYAQNRSSRVRPVSMASTPQLYEAHGEPIPSQRSLGNQPQDGFSTGGGYSSEYNSGPAGSDGYATGPCCNTDGGWEAGCSDNCSCDCGDYSEPCGGFSFGLFGCPPGRYFLLPTISTFANLSDATSYLEQTDDELAHTGTDAFHTLDFQYDSSYRFGGGYRLCNCGDEVRFLFTRLSSSANDVAPAGSIVPYHADTIAGEGGHTDIHAKVDVKSYDLEFAKTISLGGRMGCGDPCECGDACGCGPACPVWDITWSGGFRLADVGWNRNYVAVNSDSFIPSATHSAMDFRGGGVKVGLEGRRYFCKNGCLSAYLKGDISLLLGDVNLVATTITDDQSTPEIDDTATQTAKFRNIIPVTEIETGLTGNLTRNISVTSGYLFSAWHDLGFRDKFNFPTNADTRFDDGNILGFDGFFTRLEVAF